MSKSFKRKKSRIHSKHGKLQKSQTINSVNRWSGSILESYPGAWQQNIEICKDDYPSFFAVFACMSLIAADIAKLPIKLNRLTKNGIWVNSGESNLFKKPNSIQTRYQFFEDWTNSLLRSGNAYIFISRDSNGKPSQLRVLDPSLVQPLISSDGEVYYQLNADNVVGVQQQVIVRATDIIHDRINCLYHPLIGISPLFAGGLAARQGLSIQHNSTNFFINGSRPGGVVTVPGNIADEVVQKLKKQWDGTYGKQGIGGTAVLANGMDYKPISMTASDAQMIEQLGLSARIVCSVFHVPPYKIGLEAPPNNSSELDSQYYAQCLQPRLEAMEELIDVAFNLRSDLGFSFDLDSLLRMDAKARYETWSTGIKGGWMKINEARFKENLEPVVGGDTPYLQQQNYSLTALSKRDSKDDPFSKERNSVVQQQLPKEEDADETEAKMLAFFLEKELSL